MQMRFGPCPPADDVCDYKNCPINDDKLCSGQGHCFLGECHCAVDKAGADCGSNLCAGEGDCVEGQFCNAVGECEFGNAPPPPPPFTPTGLPLVVRRSSSSCAGAVWERAAAATRADRGAPRCCR